MPWENCTMRGTPQLSSSHSMLSGGKCSFNYSTQVQQPTEGRFLSAAVLMVQALTSWGAAKFTRSTPGCVILDGPSLAWAASLWPKLRRSAGSLCQRLPNKSGQLSWLVSDICMVYTLYIHGIYMVYIYTWYIHGIYMVCTWYILSDINQSSSCPETPCSVHVFPIHPTLIAAMKASKT